LIVSQFIVAIEILLDPYFLSIARPWMWVNMAFATALNCKSCARKESLV
jgi:hypothetical protein